MTDDANKDSGLEKKDSGLEELAGPASIVLFLVFAFCLGYELLVGFKGDATKIAIFMAGVVCALLLPRIKTITSGKDGFSFELIEVAKKVDKLAQKVDAANEMASEAAGAANAAASTASQVAARSADAGAPPDLRSVAASMRVSSVNALLAKLPPPLTQDDPQKGRFGGRAERNGRKLSARVTSYNASAGYLSFDVEVVSDGSAKDTDSMVLFVVHPSFTPDVYLETMAKGRAAISMRSWGAFTIGLIADDGDTLLELDLSKYLEGAPKEWRDR